MSFLSTIILAITEGLTEFLPISSTGHLIVVSRFLDITQTDNHKAFEIIIQLSAILAILLIYRKKINLPKISLWLKVFVGFLPVAVVGFIFADFVKSLFSVTVVAWAFIVGGIAFLVLEYYYQKNNKNEQTRTRELENISYTQAFKVGLWQILALIPGTSRSGATIFGGMMSNLNRKTATEFSFLIAVPVMFAASGYDLLKHYQSFALLDWQTLILASLISFLSAYISVKLLLYWLKKFTFTPFAIYRILFGLIIILFFT